MSVDGPEVQSHFSCLEGVNVATAVFVVVTKHLLVVNHKVMLNSVELTKTASVPHIHAAHTLSLSLSPFLSLSLSAISLLRSVLYLALSSPPGYQSQQKKSQPQMK